MSLNRLRDRLGDRLSSRNHRLVGVMVMLLRMTQVNM